MGRSIALSITVRSRSKAPETGSKLYTERTTKIIERTTMNGAAELEWMPETESGNDKRTYKNGTIKPIMRHEAAFYWHKSLDRESCTWAAFEVA